MDRDLLLLVNTVWTSPFLDWLMIVATSFSIWVPFLAILLVLLLWKGRFRERAFLACVALTLLIGDALITNTLKPLVNRPRPFQVMDGLRVLTPAKVRPEFLALFHPPDVRPSVAATGPVAGRSFPSGHASNNFAVATLIACFFRRRGWLMFLPAALVSYSRVYVAVHWPSDVLVSAFMGVASALLALWLAQRLWTKFAPRWLPELHRAHPQLISH